jgi:hypothetical protein
MLLTQMFGFFLIVADHEGLVEWNWVEYLLQEATAVTEETPGHFRFAIGGEAYLERQELGVGAQVAVAPGYFPSFAFFNLLVFLQGVRYA